ncbi:CHRD domain-containing protein [Aestuariivivens sp. NBU2969]|uniref:CHRD domain-containing protein n=1 Tax=Aestuariivivens sp. NBU2969 TaxID=2873267 RepID=UPI001CC0CF51|nr:CHRD domain-containing protein [Aestuariivivens sp. NBU2969]
MKTQTKILMRIMLLAIFCLFITRCSNEPISNLESELSNNDLSSKMGQEKDPQKALVFKTELSGDNEVPMRETDASGHAIVRISQDESTVHYVVIVENIDNVVASHFHKAPAGENGGVVVGIFGGPKIEELFSGQLTTGKITAETMGEDGANKLATFIQDIKDGNIYINVHTNPGYPGGELRGQL